MKRIALAVIVAVAALLALTVALLNRLDESPAAAGPGDAQRGAYLATAGHTPLSHIKAMITGWEEVD